MTIIMFSTSLALLASTTLGALARPQSTQSASTASIPVSAHSRRQTSPQGGQYALADCALSPRQRYDLPLHVGAVFVLLIASAIGVYLPALLSHTTRPSTRTANGGKSRWARETLFVCRHFGTGVLISTAFVHLLTEAMDAWSNPCIGELAYSATGPAITMAAVWVVFNIDFFLLRFLRQDRRHSAAVSECGTDHSTPTRHGESKQPGTPDPSAPAEPPQALESDPAALPAQLDSNAVHSIQSRKIAEWNVIAIEAGILFHSILVGVALGVSAGSSFIALLIAISFHQLFEGLALGSRIAVLTWKSRTHRAVMAAAFALSTPLGSAIGIAARNSFNDNNAATLKVVAIIHSLSAGILLYTALVQLLAPDFINSPQMQKCSVARSAAAIAAVTTGIVAMSVIARWA